jgi:hypothetical protein
MGLCPVADLPHSAGQNRADYSKIQQRIARKNGLFLCLPVKLYVYANSSFDGVLPPFDEGKYEAKSAMICEIIPVDRRCLLFAGKILPNQGT